MMRARWWVAHLLLLAGCGARADGEDALLPSGPRVTSMTPAGRVDVTVPLRITFSEDAPEGLIGRPRPLEAVALAQPPLEATATFVDRRTLVIAPSAPFEPATPYRIALRPDLLGPGRRLAGRRTLTFNTPMFGLEAVRGWRTAEGLELAFRFTHPVDPRAAEAALTTETPSGVLLPSRVLPGEVDGAARLRLPFRVALGAQAPPERVVVRVDAGLSSAEGGEPLGKRVRREVDIEAQAPVVDQVRPVQLGARWGVAIDLGADVVPSQLVGAVRGAGPNVRMALSPGGPWILGAFSPETTASLQIGPPLLERPSPWVVELPALRPAVRLTAPEPLLALAPGERLEVEHVGVDSLVLTARAVGPELVGLVADGLVPARPLPEAWSSDVLGPLVRPAERGGRTAIDPSPLLEGLPPGLVLLEVRDRDRPWLRDVRYLNRRGLELVVKRRAGYAWARVEDLQGPVEGGRVRVLGRGGTVLASGTTNRRGEARLRFDGGPGVVVVADDGRRFAVLPTSGPFALRGMDRPGLRALVVPDRRLLAPGQPLELSVLLADARDRPIGGRLRAKLRRERGPLVAETEIVVQARGTGRGRLEIPPEAEPGRYLLVVQGPGAQRLAQLRVAVRARRAGGARLVIEPADGPLAFTVRAEGLGRREAVHGVCHYRRLDEFAGLPAPRAPAAGAAPVPVDLGDGSKRLVRCPKPPTSGRPWSVRLEGYARETRGAEAVRVYAPEDRYAAFELPERPPEAGEPLDARLRVVDAEGRPLEGAVDVEIRALEPRSGLRVRPGGRLVPETLSVSGRDRTLTLALVDGSAVVPFVPPRGGPWRLRVGDAETTIWVGGAPGTPRPLDLVLQRTEGGVRAALPFAGRLLLAEEGLEVGATRSSLQTSVVAEHAIGAGGAGVTGLLLGAEGRWSAAALPPSEPPPPLAPVVLDVDSDLVPGEPIEVSLRVRGPAWSGVFRVLAVDAAAAPTDEELRALLSTEVPASALDTLVTAAFDDPVKARERPEREGALRLMEGRPGRAAAASAWLGLSGKGFGYTRIPWPEVEGRVRIIALVRAGGRYGFGSVERVVGDGLGLDAVVPPALRPGDRIAVPVLLDNGSDRPATARVELAGDGFAARGPSPRVRVPPGQRVEARALAEARPEGPLEVVAGGTRFEREVERIEDRQTFWAGRGASASYESPAVLPTPKQLGARRAFLAIGPRATTRFAAALRGLLERPPVDAEDAAAIVLVARALPDLARALNGEAVVDQALEMLPEGLAGRDPWLRVFSAHAGLEAGEPHAAAARQVLAEVATRVAEPAASAYARLLLARLGQAVPAPSDPPPSSRPDVVTLGAVAEILLDRAELEVLDTLPIAPFTGARQGRFSPTLIDALTLFALESLPGSHSAAGLLEAAITGSANRARWTHPAEEALALVALAARMEKGRRRPYWGSVLVDGEVEKRFNARKTTVFPLDDKLGSRPEVSVTGAGTAEVGLVLASEAAAPPVAPGLELTVRRLDAEGAPLTRPILEGRPLAVEVEVENASPSDEAVIVDVPLPAGVSVETAPAGARARPGGYAAVVDIPAGERWRGRFELRARFAGVWQIPPVTARLRHDRGRTAMAQEELRIDAE
jgi:hypothetical protein